MEDEQDLFDKLIQIKDSYEPDPDLANKLPLKNLRLSGFGLRLSV